MMPTIPTRTTGALRGIAPLALVLLLGCGGARSSPEGAVTSFLEALDARDTTAFRESFTPGTWDLVRRLEALSREVGETSGQPAITIEDWCRAFCGGTVEGSTLHGDAATVQVRVGGTVEEIQVLRQENEWRIDLEERYAPAIEMLRLIAEETPDTTGAADTTGAEAGWPDTVAPTDTAGSALPADTLP
jgi:hypothetical protein